jgi:phosphoribosylaminoimidazole (AIR) synthetase
MVVIVSPERAAAAVEFLAARGETARVIGEVGAGGRGVFIHE